MRFQRAIVIGIFGGLFWCDTVLATSASQLPIELHNEKDAFQTKNNNIINEDKLDINTVSLEKIYLKKLVIKNEFARDKNIVNLKNIADKYENKNVDINDLYEAVFEITSYFRRSGFPAATAYLPPQSVSDGKIDICVELGRYGKITILNDSRVKDSTIKSLISKLHVGETINSRKLETVINNINDIGGIKVDIILKPYDKIGESELLIQIKNGKYENYAMYSENYGSQSSGRYRYGFSESFSELYGKGDKLTVTASISNQRQHNYGIQYEQNIGNDGSKIGININKTDYELGSNYSSMGAIGNASTIGIYGVTPFYKTSNSELELHYGLEYRDLKDEMREFDYAIEKHSYGVNLGVNGMELLPKTSINYDFTIYAGNLIADKAYIGEIPLQIDNTGIYKKGFVNFNLIHGFDEKLDVLLRVQAQKAANNLDSSDQFYLGGANGIRAYPQGEGSGDEGYQVNAELRYHTKVPGLILSTYFDIGHIKYEKGNNFTGGTTLKGWGIGTFWSDSRGYWLKLDYARRIGLANDATENAKAKQRLWFSFGKNW